MNLSKKSKIGIGAAVVLVLIVVIILAVVLSQKPTCNTDVCKRTAKELKESMDQSADPCKDFYKFACGNYMKGYRLPARGMYAKGHFYDAMIKLNQDVLAMMQNEPISGRAGSAVDMAVRFFKGCKNSAGYENSQNKELLYSILRDHLGGCPLLPSTMSDQTPPFSWSRSVANIIRNVDQNFIFSVSIIPSLNVSSKPIINLYPTNPQAIDGLESVIREPPEPEPVKGYAAASPDISGIICAIDPSCYESGDLSGDIANLQEYLRRTSVLPNTKLEIKLETITIGALQGRIPTVNWLDFFGIVFSGTEFTVTNDTLVSTYVDVMNFLIDHYFNIMTGRVHQMWLGWNIILKWGSILLDNVRGLVTGESVESKCLQLTNEALGYAVGSLYNSKYVSGETYNQTMRLVLNLKEAFKELLNESSWMDTSTKNNAMIKINNMVESISGPDWARNSDTLDKYYEKIKSLNEVNFQTAVKTVLKFGWEKSVDLLKQPLDRRNYWPMSKTADTNAFYFHNTNAMMFPSGILTLPFFEQGRPSSMNYGAFGYIAGHEITHGFDNTGRTRDEFGRLRDWWTQESAKKFEDKANCFIRQYSNIYVSEAGSSLNGVQTLGENIADNGGIREAFRAYKNYQKTSGEKDERLPGMTKYGQDQLFFISAGYMYCTLSSSDFLRSQIQTDPHSPNQYRVTVPFQNSEDFSKAFSCGKKDKMNPQDKCVIW